MSNRTHVERIKEILHRWCVDLTPANNTVEVDREDLDHVVAGVEQLFQALNGDVREIKRLRAAFTFITNWHEMKWRNRLNPLDARKAHKESWQRCLDKATEVRGE